MPRTSTISRYESPSLESHSKHTVNSEVRRTANNRIMYSAVKLSIGSTTGCTITEKALTRAFS